jgi:hypothetical protein
MAGAGYQKDPSKARHAFEFSLDKQEVSRLSLTKFMIFISAEWWQTAGEHCMSVPQKELLIIAPEKDLKKKKTVRRQAQ